MGKLAGGFIDVYLLEKSRYMNNKKRRKKILCWALSKSVWNLRQFLYLFGPDQF